MGTRHRSPCRCCAPTQSSATGTTAVSVYAGPTQTCSRFSPPQRGGGAWGLCALTRGSHVGPGRSGSAQLTDALFLCVPALPPSQAGGGKRRLLRTWATWRRRYRGPGAAGCMGSCRVLGRGWGRGAGGGTVMQHWGSCMAWAGSRLGHVGLRLSFSPCSVGEPGCAVSDSSKLRVTLRQCAQQPALPPLGKEFPHPVCVLPAQTRLLAGEISRALPLTAVLWPRTAAGVSLHCAVCCVLRSSDSLCSWVPFCLASSHVPNVSLQSPITPEAAPGGVFVSVLHK